MMRLVPLALCLLLPSVSRAGFYDVDDGVPESKLGQHYGTTGGMAGVGGLDGATGLTVALHRRDGWLVAPYTLAFVRPGITGQIRAGTGLSLTADVGVAVDITRVQAYVFHSLPGVGWGAYRGTSLVLQRGLGAEVRFGNTLEQSRSPTSGLGFTAELRHQNWIRSPEERSWGWAALLSATLYVQRSRKR